MFYEVKPNNDENNKEGDGMKQTDYRRDYITVRLPKNSSNPKGSPPYVKHSITSDYINEYVRSCVEKNKKVVFDLAVYEKNKEEMIIVISIPFFEKRKPTNLFDHITEKEYDYAE
jgi:hypothetical protein